MFAALIGQCFAALEFGVSGGPERVIDHLDWIEGGAGSGESVAIFGEPRHRGADRRVWQIEIAAERIEVLVEEAAVARDDPGVVIHVAPESSLVDSIHLHVLAARVEHPGVADDEV